MTKLPVCPKVSELERLAVGQFPPSELEALVHHLEECPSCFDRMKTLSDSDTVVDVLGKIKTLAQEPEEEAVARIIELVTRTPAVPRQAEASKVDTLADQLFGDGTDATDNGSETWGFLAPPQQPDEIGRLGSYRVLKVLGCGGMGVVFQAEDPGLQRLIALKAMLPAMAASVSARKRFLREARAAAALKHDNVVTIHQVGEDRGVPFLAMEFLRGESLDQRLERDSVLPSAEVLRIGRQLAEGLAAAHEQGLIHRDIKPGNVWLEAPRGRVKILDFGLARSAEQEAGLTQQGTIIGTPAYMAPEQARGEGVDARSDLFSLGVILYRLCCGKQPFQGNDTISTLMAVATEQPPPPVQANPELPAELSDLVMQLLQKDPDRRPRSAAAVVEVLQGLEKRLRRERQPHEVADALRVPESEEDRTAIVARGGDRPLSVASASAKTALWGDGPPARKAAAPRLPGKRRVVFASLAAALLALVAAGVFFLPAGNGTIRVEINDDAIEVMLTKTGAKIKTTDGQGEVVVSAGEHKLKVKHGVLELETDRFVLKKGQTVTVKVEWLKDRLVAAKDDGTKLGSISGPPTSSPETARGAAWKPTPGQQAFIDAVAQLPLKKRIEAVTRKLWEVNPRHHREMGAGQLFLEPKDGPPTSCRVTDLGTFDIWPLVALTSLTSIDLTRTCVVDFRPLTRLPLTEAQIWMIADNVTSEEALKSMKTLKKINDTPAKDYWTERAEIRKEIDRMAGVAGGLPLQDQQDWLRAMMRKLHPKAPDKVFNSITLGVAENKLVRFRAYDLSHEVFDFSPVRGVALEDFFILGGTFFDATPLAKTKIKVYDQTKGSWVRDLSPFAGLPLTEMHVSGIGCCPVSDLRPLAGLKLKVLNCSHTCVTDLTPLKNMPLEVLNISGVSDLSPLAGLRLKRLSMGNYCPASDLSPLKGMPLESLVFDRSKVTDLSPLAGMKLKELVWSGSPVADLTPLRGMQLTRLNVGRANLDPVLASLPLQEIEVELRLHSEAEEKVLRSLKLEKINGMTPDDFWKHVAKRRKADAEKTAATAKLPVDGKTIEKALWECGQYPKLKIEKDDLVEADISHSGTTFAPLAAFPKLRKLRLESGGDYSPLLKLTLLEEFECPPFEVALNRPVLKLLPKLKTINGKPAKEVLAR